MSHGTLKKKKKKQPDVQFLIQNKMDRFWLKQSYDVKGSRNGSTCHPHPETEDYSGGPLCPHPPRRGRFSVKLVAVKFLLYIFHILVPNFTFIILHCFYSKGPSSGMFHVEAATKFA